MDLIRKLKKHPDVIWLLPINGQNHMLFTKITRLHQYYSCLMFSNEPTVSKRMCILAKEIKAELLKMQLQEKGINKK
mgnify:CR=1 FL=1